MKKKMSKKTICLKMAAMALVAGLSINSVMAYFTTYATAEGGVVLDLGFTKTEIDEKVVDGRKEIVLENTGDYDCYVRLKALTGDAYKESLMYSEPDNAGKWTPGVDGYYEYSEILAPGESSSQINVSFAFPEENPTDFNVIIIQECTPVLYDENGEAYADWDAIADVSQSIYQ